MSHYLDLGEKGKPVRRRMELGRFGGEDICLVHLSDLVGMLGKGLHYFTSHSSGF